MRLALMADLHSNLEALEACLDHARRHRVDQFAFIGDLVGYGADPSGVLDTVMALQTQGAWVVKGNHDAAAVGEAVMARPDIAQAIEWTRDRLEAHQAAFLRALPLSIEVEGVQLVHASAWAPDRWDYVRDAASAQRCLESTECAWCFVGHFHEQVLWFRGRGRECMPFRPTAGASIPVASHRQWVATIGSVGQPRDGNPAASWALFDTERHELTFYRIAYDQPRASAKILAAGLPERFSTRLARGI